MDKRRVPLSLMSRGQRMLMLALNKQMQAKARISKVEKPKWRVNKWTDGHFEKPRYSDANLLATHVQSDSPVNLEKETAVSELPAKNDPSQPVINHSCFTTRTRYLTRRLIVKHEWLMTG